MILNFPLLIRQDRAVTNPHAWGVRGGATSPRPLNVLRTPFIPNRLVSVKKKHQPKTQPQRHRRTRGTRDDHQRPPANTATRKTPPNEKNRQRPRNDPAGGATKARDPRGGDDHHQRRAARNRQSNLAAEDRDGQSHRRTRKAPEERTNHEKRTTTNTTNTPNAKATTTTTPAGAIIALRQNKRAQGRFYRGLPACPLRVAQFLALY